MVSDPPQTIQDLKSFTLEEYHVTFAAAFGEVRKAGYKGPWADVKLSQETYKEAPKTWIAYFFYEHQLRGRGSSRRYHWNVVSDLTGPNGRSWNHCCSDFPSAQSNFCVKWYRRHLVTASETQHVGIDGFTINDCDLHGEVQFCFL